jgi:hypothetical protein
MMRSAIQVGPNRTGIESSPIEKDLMIEGALDAVPSMDGDVTAIDGVRTEYLVEDASIGSLPPPAEVEGVEEAVTADPVFVDKLGERLAFERTGYRLYCALLDKFDASEPLPGGPAREELEVIRDQELAHADLLRLALLSVGADPTVVTPSADVVAVTGMGLLQVVGDPRMNLNQSLEAMLVAELVDNDGWALLVELANRVGDRELAARFAAAQADEADHLIAVRGWVVKATLLPASAEDDAME